MNIDDFSDTFRELENELFKRFKSNEPGLNTIKTNFQKSLKEYYFESQHSCGFITSCSKFLIKRHIKKRAKEEFLSIDNTETLKKALTEDENFDKLKEFSEPVFNAVKETFKEHRRITSKTDGELGDIAGRCKVYAWNAKSFNKREAEELFDNIYYELRYIAEPLKTDVISERYLQYYNGLSKEEKMEIKKTREEEHRKKMEYIKTGGTSGTEER